METIKRGRGRPHKAGPLKIQKSLSLEVETLEELTKLGNGNVSAGVERAYQLLKNFKLGSSCTPAAVLPLSPSLPNELEDLLA